jgi:hypothetical protein
MNEPRPEQDPIDTTKNKTAPAVFKIVVVVGASAAVLVALVRVLLWGVHTPDVTILEVASVPLIAAALYSLVPSVPAPGSPVRTVPASLEPSDAPLDLPLALPADPIPPQPWQGPVAISGALTCRSGESVSGASVTVIDASGCEVARS